MPTEGFDGNHFSVPAVHCISGSACLILANRHVHIRVHVIVAVPTSLAYAAYEIASNLLDLVLEELTLILFLYGDMISGRNNRSRSFAVNMDGVASNMPGWPFGSFAGGNGFAAR